MKLPKNDYWWLVVWIGLAIGLNLPAYLAVNANSTLLHTLSSDEAVYMDFVITRVYEPLRQYHWWSVVMIKDAIGYGSAFWLIYGLVSAPIYWLTNYATSVIVLRCISALWLGVGLWFVFRIVKLLSQRISSAVLATLTVLTIPALYFYSKAFSSEFMVTACAAAMIYYLIKAEGKWTRPAWLACIWLGLGIGIKFSLVILLPLIGLYSLLCPGSITQRLLRATGCVVVIGIFFLLANPYLIAEGRSGVNYFASLLSQNIESNRTNHGYDGSGITVVTWLQEVIWPQVLPVWLMVLCILGYGVTTYHMIMHKRWWQLTLPAHLLFFTGYIILTVNKMWVWYLFPTIMFWPVGLFLLSLKRLQPYRLFIESTVLIGFIALNWVNIYHRIETFRQTEQQPAFIQADHSSQRFVSWLQTHESTKNQTVIMTPYIYLDLATLPAVTAIRLGSYLTPEVIATHQPDYIILEKNYGLLMPDEEIKLWSSYADIVVERDLFIHLTKGISIDDTFYRYQLEFNTADFFVYARVHN